MRNVVKRAFVLIALPSVFPSSKERLSQPIKKSSDTANQINLVGLIDLMGETVGRQQVIADLKLGDLVNT